MRNYFNYFTEIEDYFIRKRAKNVTVSPLDWCLIELWKESRIPLHVVLRGIDQSFESAQKRRKRNPTTLSYCHPAVLEAFEEYQQAMVGAPQSESSAESALPRSTILDHLGQIESSLESFQDEIVQRERQRISALRREASVTHQLDPEQLESDLTAIGRTVTDRLKQLLDPAERSRIEDQAAEETGVYKKRVSKEMYAKLKDGYCRRRIREAFDLPDFSLFAVS